MHSQLSEALTLVVRDLRACGAPQPDLRDHDWAGGLSRVGALLVSPDGSGWGVAVTVDEPRAAQLVDVADQLQEWVVEELWRLGRPAVWPECQHHGNTHPLAPRLVGDSAAWVCPASSDVVAAIGTLDRSPHV